MSKQFQLFYRSLHIQHFSFSRVQVLAMDLRISAQRGSTEVGETDSASTTRREAGGDHDANLGVLPVGDALLVQLSHHLLAGPLVPPMAVATFL